MTFGRRPFGTTVFAGTGEIGESVEQMTDSLVLSAGLDVMEINRLLERLALTGDADASAKYLIALLAVLNINGRLRELLDISLADQVDLTAVLTKPSITVAMLDRLIVSGAATNTLAALALLAEAITLADTLGNLQQSDITDTLALADTLTNRLSAFERLIATLAFDDDTSALALVTVLNTEALNLSDDITAKAAFIAVLEEGIDFGVSFVFDETPYFGLSMNARTKAIAEYSGFDLNSITTFHDKGYGAGPDGLSLLDGDDDAGEVIAWRVRSGLRRFDSGVKKRLESAYLTHAANGMVLLKCIVVCPDESPAATQLTFVKKEYWYELRSSGSQSHQDRIDLGRGMRGVTWAFELAGDGTCPYRGEILELHPLLLEKRVP